MSIETIEAALELTTAGQWAIHQPQARSSYHIVATDESGIIRQYVAERFIERADAEFVAMAKNELPALLAEFQEAAVALVEMRRLFGRDWQAGVKQFEEAVREV